MEWVLFLLAGGVTLAAAFMVVASRNPVISSLWLVVSFCGTAALFLLQRAQFIAVVQIVVYAGAIIVFFLFVLMLLNVKGQGEGGEEHKLQRYLGMYMSGLFVLALLFALSLYPAGAPKPSGPAEAYEIGLAAPLATRLFTEYLFPFEIVSLLLLAAMVGAIVIARKER